MNSSLINALIKLFRYMAKELLDWAPVDDLTKCDMFSLGATGETHFFNKTCYPSNVIYLLYYVVYELIIGQVLPQNGEDWHRIRNGEFQIPQSAPPHLREILTSLLHPIPASRLSASVCLKQFPSLHSNLEKQLDFQISYTKTLLEELNSLKSKNNGLGKSALVRHHSTSAAWDRSTSSRLHSFS
jgi:hypothetical protein